MYTSTIADLTVTIDCGNGYIVMVTYDQAREEDEEDENYGPPWVVWFDGVEVYADWTLTHALQEARTYAEDCAAYGEVVTP